MVGPATGKARPPTVGSLTDDTGSDCYQQNGGNADQVLIGDMHQLNQGPDLQNILRQSYDYLTIMPKLRSTYDGRLMYKTSYEGRKVFLGYDSLAKL